MRQDFDQSWQMGSHATHARQDLVLLSLACRVLCWRLIGAAALTKVADRVCKPPTHCRLLAHDSIFVSENFSWCEGKQRQRGEGGTSTKKISKTILSANSEQSRGQKMAVGGNPGVAPWSHKSKCNYKRIYALDTASSPPPSSPLLPCPPRRGWTWRGADSAAAAATAPNPAAQQCCMGVWVCFEKLTQNSDHPTHGSLRVCGGCVQEMRVPTWRRRRKCCPAFPHTLLPASEFRQTIFNKCSAAKAETGSLESETRVLG